MSDETNKPTIQSNTGAKPIRQNNQGVNEVDTVERIALITILDSIAGRLSGLEKAISSRESSTRKELSDHIKDFAAIIFGGWQVFGLLLLILFYSPLYNALSSISNKVRYAEEIALPGISLKSTIRNIAFVQGFGNLGETIPTLSGAAIESLLKAPRQPQSLVSFTNTKDLKHFSSINYPSNNIIRAIQELLRKKLIEVQGGFGEAKELDAQGVERLLQNIKTKFSGHAESLGNDTVTNWVLYRQLENESPPKVSLTWKLSENGVNAVDVVLQAVSAQLEKDGKNN